MFEWIIVIAIVAVAVGYAVYKIIWLYKNRHNPCAHCAGCAIKDLVQKRKAKCPDKKRADKL